MRRGWKRIGKVVAASWVVAAFFPCCVSSLVWDEMLVKRIERIEGASIDAQGQVLVDVEYSTDPWQRISFSSQKQSVGQVIETASEPLPQSAVPVAVRSDVVRADRNSPHWKPEVAGATAESWLVWAERGVSRQNWTPSPYERLVVQPPGDTRRGIGYAPGVLRPDWNRPVGWLCGVLLPLTLTFDVVTTPIQLLFDPLGTIAAWVDWTSSW